MPTYIYKKAMEDLGRLRSDDHRLLEQMTAALRTIAGTATFLTSQEEFEAGVKAGVLLTGVADVEQLKLLLVSRGFSYPQANTLMVGVVHGFLSKHTRLEEDALVKLREQLKVDRYRVREVLLEIHAKLAQIKRRNRRRGRT